MGSDNGATGVSLSLYSLGDGADVHRPCRAELTVALDTLLRRQAGLVKTSVSILRAQKVHDAGPWFRTAAGIDPSVLCSISLRVHIIIWHDGC